MYGHKQANSLFLKQNQLFKQSNQLCDVDVHLNTQWYMDFTHLCFKKMQKRDRRDKSKIVPLRSQQQTIFLNTSWKNTFL